MMTPAEPMTLGQAVPRSARCNWKLLVLSSMLIGLGLAALWSGSAGQHLTFLEPASTLALQRMQLPRALQAMQPPMAWQPMQSTRAWQPMQWASPFQPTEPVRARQPMPLRAELAKADKYGIGSTPLEKLAITAIVVNNRGNRARDISVHAEGVESADAPPKPKTEVDDIEEARKDLDTKLQFDSVKEAVVEKVEEMAGVTPPLGFFDPLGFSTDTPAGKLLFYREVEIKHGRVAMLASLGFLIAEQFHPLFGGNIDVPSYIAFQATPLQKFWPAVLTAIAIPEMFTVLQYDIVPGSDPREPEKGSLWSMRGGRVPGDMGFDPLGMKPTDPKELKEMQTKEINNGRLAMIAAAGMVAQELATGKKIF